MQQAGAVECQPSDRVLFWEAWKYLYCLVQLLLRVIEIVGKNEVLGIVAQSHRICKIILPNLLLSQFDCFLELITESAELRNVVLSPHFAQISQHRMVVFHVYFFLYCLFYLVDVLQRKIMAQLFMIDFGPLQFYFQQQIVGLKYWYVFCLLLFHDYIPKCYECFGYIFKWVFQFASSISNFGEKKTRSRNLRMTSFVMTRLFCFFNYFFTTFKFRLIKIEFPQIVFKVYHFRRWFCFVVVK